MRGRLLVSGLVLLCACDLTPDDRYVGPDGLIPFFVASTSIANGAIDVALNQPIALELSQHLDPDSFEYFNAILVQSGGVLARGFTRYRLTDRSLTFYPTGDLRPALVYSVSINPDTVRSIRGEPLVIPFSVSFRTSDEGLTVEQAGRSIPRRSYAADVAPLFERSCNGCHAADEGLEPLDYDALFAESQQSDTPRRLVLPFYPERSYLIHKLLPEYPDRRSTVMPPPWADAAPLTTEELILVEEWILTGAAP